MKFRKGILLIALAAALVWGGYTVKRQLVQPRQTGGEKLTDILDELSDGESTGKKRKALGSLAAWAKETDLTGPEAAEAVNEWLKKQNPETRQKILEVLTEFTENGEAYLRGDGAELLKKLGIEPDPDALLESARQLLDSLVSSGGGT